MIITITHFEIKKKDIFLKFLTSKRVKCFPYVEKTVRNTKKEADIINMRLPKVYNYK